MTAPNGWLGAEARVTGPGIFQIPAAEYHADKVLPVPSLSSSGARKLVATCPARYWHDRNNQQEPSTALVIGSAAHEWLLEGETWPQRHTVLPDDHNGRTKEGKALVDAIEASGKRPIKHDDFETIKAMREVVMAHELARAALSNGKPEQSLYWRDERFGIWCRARPDWLPNKSRIVVDYKTCIEASDEHIRKNVANFGYHQQAAWYLDGITSIGLIDDPIFLFLFQEKSPPYIARLVQLSANAIHRGRQLNDVARAAFATCLRSGVWPGYSDDIEEIGLPGWYESRLQWSEDAGRLAVEFQRPLEEVE